MRIYHLYPVVNVTALKFVKPGSGQIIVTVSVLTGTMRELAHQTSTRALEPPYGLEHSDQSSILRGFASGSTVSAGRQITHASSSIMGVVAAIGHTLIRIIDRILFPTNSHGVQSSHVVPRAEADVEEQRDPDPRLPFKCDPSRGSYHTIEIPNTLVADPSIVTAIFTVADNGVGLTQDEQARLFKPFSQVRGLRGGGIGGLDTSQAPYLTLRLDLVVSTVVRALASTFHDVSRSRWVERLRSNLWAQVSGARLL